MSDFAMNLFTLVYLLVIVGGGLILRKKLRL